MEDKPGQNFTKDELLRYSRHLVLPQFGYTAQEKLKKARVVVVGAGGLGSPVLSYLAAAGVGKIRIIDFDVVSESNLQRQVLFTTENVGWLKALAAGKRLQKLNPHIQVEVSVVKITSKNALELLRDYHLVIDCTDNFPTRYLINDACVLLDLPWVYGSIFRYEGQVAIFNYLQGPNYRDLYPEPPAPGSVPDCEEGGVLGILPGIIGSIQAGEAIKVITGIGNSLAARLLTLDSLTLETQIFNIPDHQQRASIKSLIDYEDFCGLNDKKKENCGMKEITAPELKKLIDSKADFQLIDVREPYEFEICNIGGELIPMAEVPSHPERIAKDKQVVVHCRSGKRSGDMILWLEKNQGFTNLYNLKGGILAWAKDVDPTMPTY